MTPAERQGQLEKDLGTVSLWLLYAFLFGWLSVIVRGLVLFHFPEAKAAGVQASIVVALEGFLWTLAWVTVGFAIGFLFGIPKVAAPALGKLNNGLRVNTNLEDISDWLTKILVGATLTQLVKIPGAVWGISRFMAGQNSMDGAQPFNAALLLYYATLGFLAGYILTRMFFARAFAIADQGAGPSEDTDSKMQALKPAPADGSNLTIAPVLT